MKLRKASLSVLGLAAALVAAACGGNTGTNNPANQSGTLTVWLMNGSAPQSVVDGVNADFKTKYPNVTVKVELQQWGDVGTKRDTGLAGSTPRHDGATQHDGCHISRCRRHRTHPQ